MDTKRMRYGFVCSNATGPLKADMFPSLVVRSIEAALSGERLFVVLAVEKAVKAQDVLSAVSNFNASAGEDAKICLEKFEDCQDTIITFDKGQLYLQHPFYVIVQGIRSSARVEGEPPRFWEWTSDSTQLKKRKRVAEELDSDLVVESISPSAPKRERSSKTIEVVLFFCFLVAHHS